MGGGDGGGGRKRGVQGHTVKNVNNTRGEINNVFKTQKEITHKKRVKNRNKNNNHSLKKKRKQFVCFEVN